MYIIANIQSLIHIMQALQKHSLVDVIIEKQKNAHPIVVFDNNYHNKHNNQQWNHYQYHKGTSVPLQVLVLNSDSKGKFYSDF